ncbi:hypothetical protein OESDEN_09509 [Oesophagostomum dentatum]|uniref:Ras family protein n=1 Tax=Oesophagostomum dentatum TaxID=61180 RepID=A0A0B1T0B3_OESDE|nr:hypothetical protein OESDEN_09509 [Oesophagostomum dentatum]
MAAADATDVKVVVVGDSAAGKSAILTRFFDNKFEESTAFTIGIDFRHATLQLEDGTVCLLILLLLHLNSLLWLPIAFPIRRR